MIQNIEISKIQSHYNNPRKELGDLTELAESIKSNGIFQNLTVVPWFSKITGVGADDPKQQEEMGYIVVIGHRRLAAAKLAGLTEVPCAISNMSYREQIATMLLENMQRNDLTVYEQAQGFQMMLDLGESVNDICEKTGFSKSTVRQRVKLLEFDKEKFRQSVERGGTLMDYAELDKIKDTKLRNNVLEKIGTPNFKYELQNAIDKEKNKENKAVIIAELEKFATKVESSTGMQYVAAYSTAQRPVITAPADVDTVEYFYYVNSSGYIYLYKKNEKSEAPKDPTWLTQQRERDERRAALDEISNRVYQLRCEFIRNVSNTSAKKNINTIIEYLLVEMLDRGSATEFEDFANFLGIEIDEDDDEQNLNNLKRIVSTQHERHLLISTYLMIDSAYEKYYDWTNQYKDNEHLNTVYDFLEKFGYQVSDEETSLRNGIHKLFITTEDK